MTSSTVRRMTSSTVTAPRPVRIAVIGDFSGVAHDAGGHDPDRRSPGLLEERQGHVVRSVADLDAVMARLKPEARVRVPAQGTVALRFTGIADFDPRRLAASLQERRPAEAADDATLRLLLHDPSLQALEASWRGVALLVARLAAHTADVLLFDVGDGELERAFMAAGLGYESPLSRMLRSSPSDQDGAPEILVWLREHTARAADVARLQAIARLGEALEAICLGAAHPSLAALDATEPGPGGEAGRRWRALRAASAAAHLQLLMPRFLLRLPHGHGEAGAFQEIPPGADLPTLHARLLWGNPALLAAVVLARGGDAERSDPELHVDDLPILFTRAGDRSCALPCAESLLAEESALVLLRSGVTPLICHRGESRVRLTALRSVAASGAPLAGTPARAMR